MDNTKPYTKAPKPEIGRGCTFYYAPEGVAAKPCEGCYKLHETAWLEQYPQHTPTDIFEVRFKNTRRSTTKTSIICRWNGATSSLWKLRRDTTSASSP